MSSLEASVQQLRGRLHAQAPTLPTQAGSAAASLPASQQPPGSSRPGHVRGMTGIEAAMLKLEDQLHRLTREHSDLQQMDDFVTRCERALGNKHAHAAQPAPR